MNKVTALVTISLLVVVVIIGLGVNPLSTEADESHKFTIVRCVPLSGSDKMIVEQFSKSTGVTTTKIASNCAQTLANLRNNDEMKIKFVTAPDGADSSPGIVYTLEGK